MTKERAIKVIDCILNDMLCDGCIGEETTSCVECRREVADMAIEALGEEKTGKWVGGEWGHCSCCGHEGCASDIWNTGKINFCPNCGVRMVCADAFD